MRCRLGSCQLMQRSEMQARGLSADAEKVDWRLDDSTSDDELDTPTEES